MNPIATSLLGIYALTGCAHGDTLEEVNQHISIERAIVVTSQDGDYEVAAYGIFVNRGPGTRIIQAQCDCAEKIELHVVVRDGPDPGMFNAWPLELPAASRTTIEPPGIPRHMMLMGLKQAIPLGTTLRLRFQLDDGEWIERNFVAVESSTEAWRNFDTQIK